MAAVSFQSVSKTYATANRDALLKWPLDHAWTLRASWIR